MPGLTNWRGGTNLTTMTRAWDMALTGEFATLEDMLAYRAHSAHLDAEKFLDAYAADTISVDFDPTVPSGAAG